MSPQSDDPVPHPPYDELRSALGDHTEGHAALDDLHAVLSEGAPDRARVESRVERLRGIPAVEARIANWFDSPATQRWLLILTDAGLLDGAG